MFVYPHSLLRHVAVWKMVLRGYTLTKTNVAPEDRPSKKESGLQSFSNHQFSAAMSISGGCIHVHVRK